MNVRRGMDESCFTYKWVMSDHNNEAISSKKQSTGLCISDESCLTCEWVMSHVLMSHVSYRIMKRWAAKAQRGLKVSHVSRVNESSLVYECVMSHKGMSHICQAPATAKVMSHVWHRTMKWWVMSHIEWSNGWWMKNNEALDDKRKKCWVMSKLKQWVMANII